LDAGTAPAEAAVTVGFTDQPHLNRHFARIVGVPPGAYQRERGSGARPRGRKNVQDARDGGT
ncbi:AraC family transcriptional regulator, partial [Streptomyces sp. NPDC048279]